METFKKRPKKVRRLERQKDTVALRIQRVQNRAGFAKRDVVGDTLKAEPDGSLSVEPTPDV